MCIAKVLMAARLWRTAVQAWQRPTWNPVEHPSSTSRPPLININFVEKIVPNGGGCEHRAGDRFRSRWTPWRCDFSVILCFGAWKGIEVCEMGLWGWKLSKNWKIVRLFCLIRSVRVWEMMWRCLCEWLIVGALIRSYSCYSRLVYDLLMIEKKILSHLLHGAS